MRVGLMMEGYVPRGSTPYARLKEMVGQAQLAEEVGLNSFSVSEQHFKYPTNSVPQTDIILTAVARETTRIRVVPAVVVLPLHHPLHVAERLAMLDVFSDGRLDVGIGRGNTAVTADAFDVPIPETEERSVESLRVILQAWTKERFGYEGKYFRFKELAVTPKPIQSPHPDVYWAATSPSSHERGGAYGFHLMTGANAVDWGQVQRRIDRFNAGVASGREDAMIEPPAKRDIRINMHGFCAEDDSEAHRIYRPYVVEYVNRTVTQYKAAVQRSGKKVDFTASERFQDNYDAVINETPNAIGAPERCIAQLRRLAAMGVDEVTFRIDGPTDEEIRRCITLLGTEVVPALQEQVEAPALTTEAVL